MAAQLDITYTPQYVGCHRICFRTTQVQYCCYLDTSPSVVNTPKTVSLVLEDFVDCLTFVPQEISCSGTTPVTGYIQPCCSDENSEDNRVAFTASFISTPCTPYQIECEESGIGEISIINPGYGWPIGVVPTISVNTTGSGSGFLATITMDCLPGDNFCSIDDITIDDPGINYFYLYELSLSYSPEPSCVSNELLIDGNFVNGYTDWTVGPFSDSWLLAPGMVPYYNIPVYSSTGGSISQNILEPGKTYLIDFEKVIVECNTGVTRFIVTAGTFNPLGTAPNQYIITKNAGDPDYDGPLIITLVCSGSTEFSIYGDSSTTDVLNRVTVTAVSVTESCEAIVPEFEIAQLDDCGTFTVPNCNGVENPTQYAILGAPEYAINVCAGGEGPEALVGGKYNITPEPAGVSCCECKLYNIIVRNPIDVYYTDCNQTIDIVSVEPGVIGVTVCAITGSVWPANKLDNAEILAITEVGDCIPTE